MRVGEWKLEILKLSYTMKSGKLADGASYAVPLTQRDATWRKCNHLLTNHDREVLVSC
uniref:AlNc14C106G6221 protein n=1 Tax=Albugo laibachii Nc14 TaxID=890382 RepID=F0WI14_9STRA|nr:AlNc14C106G6221 [Albugo laibachii Nc14]|eukprot:CCA20891.1 AlNc14C106G6221 [Albugo laibachii Nc14]